jgi:signal peptidase II
VSALALVRTTKFRWFAIWTVVLVVLDQITKIWVVDNIRYRTEEIQLIPGFLSLVHAQNPGAAMGLMNSFEYRMHLFAVFTVVALVVLLQMLWQLPNNDRFQSTGLGLITSGAAGNAIDRVDKQSVTDFVRVYTENPSLRPTLIEWFGTAEWPSFNVADAAIVVGLGMFMIHFLFLQEDEDDLEPAPPNAPLPDDISGS